MKNMRVAIIGAGIAGLAAAGRLRRAGCRVSVFDKARGVGGRTATRRREPHAFDHGAQYFTCKSEVFERQVEDWCRRGVAALWQARIVGLEAGVTSDDVSGALRYVGVPRMSALARDLAVDLKLQCEAQIESVQGSRRRWNLTGAKGTSPRFECVVVATPAPQAVPLLSRAPDLAARAASVLMLPCHAVMATFVPFESADAPGFDAAFVSRSPLSWVARNGSKPERPEGESWVLHSSPAWSAEHLDTPAEDVATELLAAFAAALGRELPPVTASAAHRWLYARTEKPLEKACLWDPSRGIGVCGDWLHGSRVEDAFTSGDALARAMLGESVEGQLDP